MTNVAVLILVLFLAGYIGLIVHRRQRGIVARRGTGIGADLGTLADTPRVRVRALTRTGPDRVRLVLVPEVGRPGPGLTTSPDLDLIVLLDDDAFGWELLQEWERSQTSLAIVLPPGSQIVRLRSIDDLQPLTLRRVGEE